MQLACLVFLKRMFFFLSNYVVIDQRELNEGLHRFDFSFELPQNLPQSFESLKGHIRYRIKAYLEINKDIKHDSTLHVKLNRIEDLNMSPSSITNPYANQNITSLG